MNRSFVIVLGISFFIQHIGFAQGTDKTTLAKDTLMTISIEGMENLHFEGPNLYADISLKQAQQIKIIECSNKDWTVQSFRFTVGTDLGLLEMNMSGNDFRTCAAKIKYSGKGIHFFLEDVVVKNSQNQQVLLRDVVVHVK